jgi:hypothetical protein
VEPPGIESAPNAQSREITRRREDVASSTKAPPFGNASDREACAIAACDSHAARGDGPDVIEVALAEGLRGAKAAERWELMAQLAQELEARRRARSASNRTNLLIYHGVLAPNAKLHSRAVHYGRPSAATTETPRCVDTTSVAEIAARSPTTRPRNRWPDLMRRAFGLDVLQCPRCDGRMRLLATYVRRSARYRSTGQSCECALG